MAILNQTWERMDGDFITLKFTVVDNTNISNYRAWFGLSSASSEAEYDTADALIRHTGLTGAPGGTNSPNWNTPTGACSATAIGTNYAGIEMESSFLVIHIGYALFENGTTGNTLFPPTGGFNNNGVYYYELVLSPTGDQCSATVVADGNLSVEESLFQSQGYRGDY